MSIPHNIADTDASKLRLRQMHQIELFQLRSKLLSGEDKALMQMIFDNGTTFDQIAKLTGQNASTISRRFKNLLQKLIARELVTLLNQRKNFDTSDISIVQEYYLRGQSQKAIAQKLSISLYRVRNTLGTVRSIVYHHCAPQSHYTKRNRKHLSSKEGIRHAYPKR